MEKCRICNNEKNNKKYLVKERQLNQGETFEYLYCAKCGTLQLMYIPDNIGEYYSNSYYAFREDDSLKKDKYLNLLLKLFIMIESRFEGLSDIFEKFQGTKVYQLKSLSGSKVCFKDSILDVGCGTGNWLQYLSAIGFENLTGLDLFADPIKDRKWKFIKGEITELPNKETYDYVFLNHSFEHMNNPNEALSKIHYILKREGTCVIRIPVIGKKAWRTYKENWYQIDAPRHIFLYSVKAFNYLAKKSGFKLIKVKYDSIETQFRASEYYQKTDWNLDEIYRRTDSKRQSYVKKAIEANRCNDGDQAIFYLKKL